MMQWTEPARRLLEEYCARSRPVLAGAGADVDEVSDDLRRHVEQEVQGAGLSIVTEEHARRILSRIGDPVMERPNQEGSGGSAAEARRPGFWLLAFGVFLPAVTFLFEAIFGASAGAVLDPFPTWLHWIAVASTPAINGWIWKAARAGDARHSRLLEWLSGAVLGICIYYSVLYIGFVPFACFGLLFFGLGLLPLSPYFALASTAILRRRYAASAGRTALAGGWVASAGAIALLLLVQFPTGATYYGLAKAASEEPDERTHGVRVLRMFGDDELMLRACYGSLSRPMNFDVLRALTSGSKHVAPEQARAAYYRVTGKAFNSVQPPALFTRTGRWTELDREFTWDDALGGEAVAQRVKGLSLLSSRMDAVAEPSAALVYCEWIMEFKNVSTVAREARAQVALPPGAVVSRVSLWIDGEEREAAFGGRGQVRKAYQEVAVVQRRDPILVTTCGPDRVLMQCFPVLPNGGVMKVKLGITAPLLLQTEHAGQFAWPKFLERNFAVAQDFTHELWVESPRALTNGSAAAAAPVATNHPFALRSSVTERRLSEVAHSVAVARDARDKAVWTPATDGGAIRQVIQPRLPLQCSRLAIVVDGSTGMEEPARALAGALDQLPQDLEVALLLASDDADPAGVRAEKASLETIRRMQSQLRRASFHGGQDNLRALEAAWDVASQTERGCVLWIHGPEPVLLSSENALRQRADRNLMRTRVVELQTENGPDRLLEALDGVAALQRIPRLGSLRDDLGAAVALVLGKGGGFELKRERVANAEGVRVSRHLERLWARDEACRLIAAQKQVEAAALAAKNQLVTPVTGAVVLETKEQYDRHGLNPAEAGSVPSVPEPTALTLLLIGAGALAARRRIHRAQIM